MLFLQKMPIFQIFFKPKLLQNQIFPKYLSMWLTSTIHTSNCQEQLAPATQPLLSDHLLGNSCPLSWNFVFIVFCVFVVLVISHFGIEGGICLLIAPVPVHCILITFSTARQNENPPSHTC